MTPAALAELIRATTTEVLATRGIHRTPLPSEITVARPRDPEHGDYATPVALRAAERVGVPALELAGWLAGALTGRDGVRLAEVSGPGFVNVRLSGRAVAAEVRAVLAARPDSATAGNARPSRRAEVSEAVLARARYAHAELAALRRQAADLGLPEVIPDTLDVLTAWPDIELVRTVGEFDGADLARYLDRLELAYHRWVVHTRALPMGDEPTTPAHLARLALAAATRRVFAEALSELGVHAPERM